MFEIMIIIYYIKLESSSGWGNFLACYDETIPAFSWQHSDSRFA